MATSVPGESAGRLRRTFYRLMALPEPGTGALTPAYPVADLLPERQEVRAWWAHVAVVASWRIRLARWPADVLSPVGRPPEPLECHLVTAHDHPRPDLRALAAIVLVPQAGPATEAVFHTSTACRWVVRRTDSATFEATSRDGTTTRVRVNGPPGLNEVAATALLLSVDAGVRSGHEIDIEIGGRVATAVIEPAVVESSDDS